MKKAFALLAALCLIIGLLPTVALAAPAGFELGDFAYIMVGNAPATKITKAGGEVAYFVNDADGNITQLDATAAAAAAADGSWNVKLEYVGDVTQLTLKNAKIGSYNAETQKYNVVGGGGLGNGLRVVPEGSGGAKIDLTIVLEGANNVTCEYMFLDGNSCIGDLIIKGNDGSSLDVVTNGIYETLAGAQTITFDNVKASFDVISTKQFMKSRILAPTMTVKNSEINYKCIRFQTSAAAWEITNDLNIINSKVNIHSTTCRAINAKTISISGSSDVQLSSETGLSVLNATEGITVTDSKLKAVHLMTGKLDGSRALITSASADIIFKNSEVSLTRGEMENSYNCYGVKITNEASLVIDGGSVTLATNVEDDSYGLYLESDATATIKGNANVSVTGLTYIDNDESLVVESGTLTFTGSKSSVEGVLKATGGTVKYLVEDAPEETEGTENTESTESAGNTNTQSTESTEGAGNNNTQSTENTEGTESTEAGNNTSNTNTESTKGTESNQGNESTKGTEAINKPSDNKPSDTTGNKGGNVILWIVAIILVAAVAAAAVLIVLKNKKASAEEAVADADEVEEADAAEEVTEEIIENSEAAE